MTPKWDLINKSTPQNLKIFDAVWYQRRHPVLDKTGNFIVLDSPTWVNIIPITTDNKIVLIEQYRHGIDNITIEIPGGLVEKNENTRIAAERECAEETGYTSTEEAEILGETLPNPAFLNNSCFCYLLKNCSQTQVQKLDRHEDIRVFTASIEEIRNYILSGKINHSLVLTAFFYYSLKYSL